MGKAPFVAMQTDLKKDDRVELISQITGLNEDEVLGKLFRLWARCTDRGLEDAPDDCEGYAVPERVIVQYFGEHGVRAFLGDDCDSLAMGVRRHDNLIYLRGTHETVSRFRSVRATAKAGGRSAAGSNRRGVNGQYVSNKQFVQPTVQPDTSRKPADVQPESSSKPAADPAESSHTHTLKDLSHARAIPPTAVPSTNREVTLDEIWNELETERERVAGSMGISLTPLMAHDSGRHELASALSQAAFQKRRHQAVADARKAIAVAGEEVLAGKREFKWFTGVIFEAKNWRALCGSSVDEARSRRDQRPANTSAGPTRKTTIL